MESRSQHKETQTLKHGKHEPGYTKRPLCTQSALTNICRMAFAYDHTHAHKHSKRTQTLAFTQIPYLHQENLLLSARDLTQLRGPAHYFPSHFHSHTQWCWRSVSAKPCFRHLFLRLLMKGCYTHMHTKPMKCRCANRRSLDTVVM